ncbi:MAG: aryl-sulfate sulfotransferase [Saprospiraceae bacterium]|nr:aryl-sulfate sulfotransferase [Saprospiraceae bacterium]
MKKLYYYLLFLFCILSFSSALNGQTVGLFSYQEGSQNGYTLFNPFFTTSTYLIDNCGRVVNEWESTFTPGASTRLLENGHLLRTATTGIAANPVFPVNGAGERIQEVDWDGNILWEFIFSDSTHRMHHDFTVLENGNLLFPAWELKTEAEAIQAGRNPALIPDGVLWAEFLVEVDRNTSEIVWEWHFWDHLIQDFDPTKDNYGVVADHPELLDINVTGGQTANGGANCLHINAIDYNPTLDQILINSFFITEMFIIDHSTTTAEAATHTGGTSTQGGDILFRWGNPQNYGYTPEAGQIIYGCHNPHWIPEGLNDAGKIMYFQNGNGRPDGNYSSVDIFTPPIANPNTGQYTFDAGVSYGPTGPEWSYTADPVESLYSGFVSGAQRLSNGNTLICSGANGHFLEINQAGETVWEYINPAIPGGAVTQGNPIPANGGFNLNIVFRCLRYEPNFPGLAGKDLTPGDPIELGFPVPYDCEIFSGVEEVALDQINVYPNPAYNILIIESTQLINAPVSVFNAVGQLVESFSLKSETVELELTNYPSGIYFLKVGNQVVKQFLVQK